MLCIAVSEFGVTLAPDPSFIQTVGGSSDGSRSGISTTHLDGLGCMYGVNQQQTGELCLFLFPPLTPCLFKYFF